MQKHVNCFPKSLRITNSKDYKKSSKDIVFSSKKLIFVLRKNELSYARLGVTVSKRQFSKAVTRVRLKRIFKESFRVSQSILPAYDIIIIARKGLESDSNFAITNLLSSKWQYFSHAL